MQDRVREGCLTYVLKNDSDLLGRGRWRQEEPHLQGDEIVCHIWKIASKLACLKGRIYMKMEEESLSLVYLTVEVA